MLYKGNAKKRPEVFNHVVFDGNNSSYTSNSKLLIANAVTTTVATVMVVL